MDVVVLKEVFKSLEGRKILDGVSIAISQGDIFGLFGPNGSGKSVLIKIIIGFFKEDRGSVFVNAKVGFSMQHNSFYDNLTLLENLKYFATLYNVKDKESINILIRSLYLEDYIYLLMNELSGGTKKRADIALALLNNPELLVLDEPFTGLDSYLINQMITFLQEINKKGVTILLSTHDVGKVENFCTKFGILTNGKISLINKETFKKIYS